MTADGIVCRIKEPAVWAEALKTVGKEEDRHRLCIDLKELSKNIKRKYFHVFASNNMCAEGESQIPKQICCLGRALAEPPGHRRPKVLPAQ